MSTFKVEVVPVKLEKHPNADNLSLAVVKGWTCVVRTSDFENIKLAAYIPIDSIVPKHNDNIQHDPLDLPTSRFAFVFGRQKDQLDEDGKTICLEWEWTNRGGRIKASKLRGVVSMGLLVPAEPHWVEGQDVTGELGIIKFDPPEPTSFTGDTVKMVSGFLKYTDIENLKNFPNVFKDGEEVIAYEKIHGTNARFGFVEGTYCVGSHTQCKDPQGKSNIYSLTSQRMGIEERIRKIIHELENEIGSVHVIIIFGEIYGASIQKHWEYAQKIPTFRPFDIFVNGRFLNDTEFKIFADKLGLLPIPVIYRGPFSMQKMSEISAGDSVLSPNTIMEGIVIRPLIERYDIAIGRAILKRISDEYEVLKHKKNGTDFH